ncbi:ADP-ribosylglycohydrolase [uncultured archaeon]|nr:ADP-ribosylglycohydrolase [uncultured archaeon]
MLNAKFSGVSRRADKARGTLVGVAVGDALGMPTERVPRALFGQYFNGPVHSFQTPPSTHYWSSHLKAGQYTDDTYQTLALSQSLVDKGLLDLKDFSIKLMDMADRYGFYGGRTSIQAIKRLKQGVSPYESGKADAKTNGSAMRASPVGIFFEDYGEAVQQARFSSIPTHNSILTQDAAAFVAGLVNLFVHHGLDGPSAISKALSSVRDPNLAAQIQKALALAKSSDADHAAAELGTGSSAVQTLGYAVFCFALDFNDFERAVVTAANVDNGDSDTIASIAGALSGAHGGLSGIPSKFHSVDNFGLLVETADRLLSFSQATKPAVLEE